MDTAIFVCNLAFIWTSFSTSLTSFLLFFPPQIPPDAASLHRVEQPEVRDDPSTTRRRTRVRNNARDPKHPDAAGREEHGRDCRKLEVQGARKGRYRRLHSWSSREVSSPSSPSSPHLASLDADRSNASISLGSTISHPKRKHHESPPPSRENRLPTLPISTRTHPSSTISTIPNAVLQQHPPQLLLPLPPPSQLPFKTSILTAPSPPSILPFLPQLRCFVLQQAQHPPQHQTHRPLPQHPILRTLNINKQIRHPQQPRHSLPTQPVSPAHRNETQPISPRTTSWRFAKPLSSTSGRDRLRGSSNGSTTPTAPCQRSQPSVAIGWPV
jgi:hypothetical protein